MEYPAPQPAKHFVSVGCKGEVCGICSELLRGPIPAAHKVVEVIHADDPHPDRQPLTQYLCCQHFAWMVGIDAQCK